MRKQFKDLSELHPYLYSIMTEVIIEDLEPYVKKLIQGAIYEKVYSTYQPVVYERRGDGVRVGKGGGLGDTKLMVSSTITNSLESGELHRFIENLAVAADNDRGLGPGEFAKAIQTQNLFAGDPAAGMPARPYMYVVKNRIENNPEEFLELIKKGFRKRNINVR